MCPFYSIFLLLVTLCPFEGSFYDTTIIYDPVRISVIPDKNPREMVMLRGCGCKWKKCRFCDYHMDASPDAAGEF